MAMSEAAPCLMRSVSQPLFASREFNEGDPLRALTTSVSFGRFMTEPLEWEKWSSFSHNRTREDVLKHSRPGAVAEKKAFFEAYFNRFASKKSAKPPKKENKPPNYSYQPIVTPENHQSPTVAVNENTNSRGVELEITSNRYVSSPSINLVFSKTECNDDIISSTCLLEQGKSLTGNVSSPVVSSTRRVEREISSNTNGVLPETRNVDDIISNTSHAKHEQPGTNLVCSQSGKVEDKVSSNRGAEWEIASNKDVCSSTSNPVFSNVDDVISSSGQMEHETTSTKNVSLEDHHQSKVKISKQSIHVDKSKKRLIKDNKSWQTTRTSSFRKASVPEIHPKNQILKCNPKVLSVNVVKKNSQVLPIPENKRLNDHSVNGNKTVVLKSHSISHSNASTKKTRSVTVPSSFSFKSDERAAKRKQFFQKLEEKSKLKEGAKLSTSETKGPTSKIQKIMQGQPSRTLPQKLGVRPKNFIEINKKNLSNSITYLLSKKLHD